MKSQKANCISQLIRVGVLAIPLTFSACASKKTFTLMPTPVLYHHSGLDPFTHLNPSHRTTTPTVFYATTRAQSKVAGKLAYGNRVDSDLHLGIATVRMGNSGDRWEDLKKSSLADNQNQPIPVALEQVEELATMPVGVSSSAKKLSPELKTFVKAINEELAIALDPEIMIYVHGTKVDFANSVLLTSEIDHFAGRDFVGIGFAWPSHQNILKYVSGTDVRRAINSSGALKQLISLLAEHTTAERINILTYSAGGKVVSKALFELREEHSSLDANSLKKKIRIGTAVFAAADVEVDVFLEKAKAISELATHVVLTVSDDDNVLRFAKKYMGGNFRMGVEEALSEEDSFIINNRLENIEIIDVSAGKEQRGFDIVGHHYWYRHPWISSDIIFTMRTGLPASRRGLSAAEMAGVWSLSSEYPEKISRAAKTELQGQW